MTRRVNHEPLLIGSNVLVCNCSTGPEWLLGTVVNSRGSVSYIVKLSDGRHIKHHVDHLRKTEVTATDYEVAVPELIDDCIPIQPPAQTTTTANTAPPTLHRSTSCRVRTAPDRLTYPSN